MYTFNSGKRTKSSKEVTLTFVCLEVEKVTELVGKDLVSGGAEPHSAPQGFTPSTPD